MLHTHPYDRTEGSFNGVSFSGGDIAYQLINKLKLMVVQSGPRFFGLVLTLQSPEGADFDQMNDNQNDRIAERTNSGRTFQQSSRIEAEITAAQNKLAYYQGWAGVLTRVSPA